jgi:heptosyltransferase-1
VVRAALPGGGDVPLCGPLYIADEPKKQIEDYMEQLEWVNKTIVVFHYGTTWRTKLWDLNMWQQLAAKLTQRPDTSIILTWGSTEEHRAAEKIIENLDGEIVIWPRVPLPEFAALLARADLVVGGDTGPVHIAAAAGTPTVSMYRATDALRNGPEGEKHIRLQSSMPCAKCLRKECEYDPQCSTSIRVEDVMNAISNILDVKSEGA